MRTNATHRVARGGTLVLGGGFAGAYVARGLGRKGATIVNPANFMLKPRWVLVDHSPRILGQTPESLARSAARTLERRGIEIVCGAALATVDAGGATLADGTRIPARTVVWTAGIEANPVVERLGLPVDERGRVRVKDTLEVQGMDHVWALGDCAAVPNAAHDGELDPPTCQHALRQARRLATNLRGEARPYRYRTRGQMATLGRRHGIAVLGKVRMRGLAGWLVARGYHLMALPFAARRARVLADWCHAALFRRDVAALGIAR